MAKYKEYFKKMLDQNKEDFENFRELHDRYALNPNTLQEQFNKEGEKILRIIREWENRLCLQSEKAGYSTFTTGLSEKFQMEVRSHFPKIDSVGLIIEKKDSPKNIFFIKKIKL